VVDLLRASVSNNIYIPLHTKVNDLHSTPLVLACMTGSSHKVVEALLQQEGGGTVISLVNQKATNPFSALICRYIMLRKLPTQRAMSRSLEEISSLGKHHDAGPLFDVFWKTTDTLIQAAWFDDADDQHEGGESRSLQLRESYLSLLHGAAYVSELLPPILTSLILRCHPELVSQSPKGILPLHLAVTAVDTNPSPPEQQPTLRAQRTFFIDQLLKVDPSTANHRMPGSHRLPLTEAIDSGLLWHNKTQDDEDDDDAGPLQVLWNAAPDALYESDPVTGLKPFMLAATKQQIDHASQIDTIYSLLRRNPESIFA
jgi:hypothetical protein